MRQPIAEPAATEVAWRPRTARAGTLPMPPDTPVTPLSAAERQERIERLRRRRASFDFELAQAELATQPANPWQERISLLSEALATVTADQQRLQNLPPAPTFPVPATPIRDIRATTSDPAEVSFKIGPESFAYREEIDWDERGGAVERGQLQQQSGNPKTLLPVNLPPALRTPLLLHLTASLVLLAADLRDRALAGETLPAGKTLVDLARPCQTYGGWHDWLGRCTVKQERAYQAQQLEAELRRLLDGRAKELDEQHRWAEQLPVIHRRLADIDREIAALGG